MSKKIEVTPWFKWLLIILGLSFIYSSITSDISYGISIAGALGSNTFSIIGLGVAMYCGSKCVDWANKISKKRVDINAAYSIGFIFGLIGLVGYWLYYRNKLKSDKNKVIAIIILFIIMVSSLVYFYYGDPSYVDEDPDTYEFFIYPEYEDFGIEGFIFIKENPNVMFVEICRIKDGYCIADASKLTTGTLRFNCRNCNYEFSGIEYEYDFYEQDIKNGYTILEVPYEDMLI